MLVALTRILPVLGFVVPLLVEGQVQSVPELELLQKKFDAQVQVEVGIPFQNAVAQLNQGYVIAVEKEGSFAQQSGRLNEVMLFQTEKQQIEKGLGVPEQDDGNTPGGLKKLRVTYRASLAKLTAEKERKLQPLQDALAKSLAGLVTSLTRAGKIEDASIVEKNRLALQVDPAIRRFEGTWTVNYDNRTSRRLRIDAFGKVEWLTKDKVSATTQLTKKGGDCLLDFNDGKIERLTMQGSKLMVEHFNPKTLYPRPGPNHTGTGEKAK
jgi:hypothetical protein